MKFKTIGELETWLRDYGKPYGDSKTFLKNAVLSKDPFISTEERFVMDENVVYVINRAAPDPQDYYITYTDDKESDKMWWTTVSKIYNRNMNLEQFVGFGMVGWPSMEGAKIWILTGDKFENFINWMEVDPFKEDNP